MYFPASHLSHSPSIRMTENSPLLSSYPRYWETNGALVPSLSSSALSVASATVVYLRLAAVFGLSALLLLLCGLFFFDPAFAQLAALRLHGEPQDDDDDGAAEPEKHAAFPLLLVLLLLLLIVVLLLLAVNLPRHSAFASVDLDAVG